jgi:hypothetical protein
MANYLGVAPRSRNRVRSPAVDTNAAIDAAHIACAQIANGEQLSTVVAIVAERVPTISRAEYWITAGAQQAYCPN